VAAAVAPQRRQPTRARPGSRGNRSGPYSCHSPRCSLAILGQSLPARVSAPLHQTGNTPNIGRIAANAMRPPGERAKRTNKKAARDDLAGGLVEGWIPSILFTPSASADRSPPGSPCRCGRRSSTGSASALRRSSCPRPEGSEEPAGPTGLAAASGLLRQSGR